MRTYKNRAHAVPNRSLTGGALPSVRTQGEAFPLAEFAQRLCLNVLAMQLTYSNDRRRVADVRHFPSHNQDRRTQKELVAGAFGSHVCRYVAKYTLDLRQDGP